MQNFVVISAGSNVSDGLTPLMQNDETILSNSAGTAYPTTNLYIGMNCYRTDIPTASGGEYKLTSLTPTWTLMRDYSKTVIHLEEANTNYASAAVFVASGGSHAKGLVPDPGSSVGTTKYLCEDAIFKVPAAESAVADIASAATCDLGSAASRNIRITGATGPITSFGTSGVIGRTYITRSSSTPTITVDGTHIIAPISSIVMAIGDVIEWLCEASNVFRFVSGTKADGKPLVMSGFSDVTGTAAVAQLPVFVASGTGHAAGIVPDPGGSSGTTKFLREDSTWAAPAVAVSMHHSEFTSGGTFTASISGLHKITTTAAGGGGANSGGSLPSGGGGGAGGTAIYYATLVASTGYTVVVGAGGAGGATIDASGSAGGASSFAGPVTVTANGGAGGVSNDGAGGAGGTTSNGTINITGGDGGAGVDSGAGVGGASFWGGGGGGGGGDNIGLAGKAYGSGGGGGVGGNSAGGDGKAGIITVEWIG